jgi:hypothetical protein
VVHEADQAIVPVVVAGQGVDGVRVVLVGLVELGLVVLRVSRWVDDVAAEDHEIGVPPTREQRLHHRVLRGVTLPGVPDNEEGDLLEVCVLVEDKIPGELPGLSLHLHPATALVVDRVPEDASQDLVAGLPEGYGVQPREGQTSEG